MTYPAEIEVNTKRREQGSPKGSKKRASLLISSDPHRQEVDYVSKRAISRPVSVSAWTMSPEQSQYIWRKTIPHIEVGMGSGVFTSHRSARFVLISD